METKRFAIIASAALAMLASASIASAQEHTLRLGHANAATEDSVYQIIAETMKERLEHYSDGKATIQIFPSGQLGADADMIEFVKGGTLDIQVTSLNLVSGHAPRLDALFLPYMFPDKADAIKVTEQFMGELNDYAVKRGNFRLLDLPHTGYRKLMTTTPVKSLEELRAIKFRLPPSPVMLETFGAYGVKSTPIPWGELFSAMQLGVVDGFEVDLTPLVSARFNEVVKYVTDVDWVSQISVAVMSETRYQSLPQEIRDAVDKAAADTRKHMIETMDKLEKRIVEASDKVEFLGRPTDYDTWIATGRSVWPKFYERIGDGDAEAGKAFVERISKAVSGS